MLKEQQTSSSSSFFLFPNPNPLLRSFKIPAPVIHPPGIDPYSLLNPNQYDDNGLKPMPPLDVDPCAASRTEIIGKTTDLTASEHAGGGLNVFYGICCNSYDELYNQVLEKKHQKKLKKTENSLQDLMDEDGKVVIIERCKRKANGSLASEEDADTKRRR